MPAKHVQSASAPPIIDFLKIQIGEQPIERISNAVEIGLVEAALRPHAPEFGRGERQVVLAVEMMEEAALGHPGGGTDIVDPRRIVALGPHDIDRRGKQLGFGCDVQKGQSNPSNDHTN